MRCRGQARQDRRTSFIESCQPAWQKLYEKREKEQIGLVPKNPKETLRQMYDKVVTPELIRRGIIKTPKSSQAKKEEIDEGETKKRKSKSKKADKKSKKRKRDGSDSSSSSESSESFAKKKKKDQRKTLSWGELIDSNNK